MVAENARRHNPQKTFDIDFLSGSAFKLQSRFSFIFKGKAAGALRAISAA